MEFAAPFASFQLALGTTPATSDAAMGVPSATKSIEMTFVDELEVTLRVVVAVCVILPLVPVIVSV